MELDSIIINATARTRVNLAVPHLLSACGFSRQVRQMEEAHLGEPFGGFWEEIFAHATASILLTVAALESYINEVFSSYDSNFPGFSPEVLGKLWDVYELKPILDKYELALCLRNAGALDRGLPPVQDVALLIRLRNALTHFKPEWFNA
jgi:hypothetical protein